MTNRKTFRLFISSTFSDFRQERRILHEKVFPYIDKFLLKNYPEYTFQAIDLRWGVSAEAQLDQKTLEVCLNEVKACKHYPHPNFLIMSGNRYGWVPLPYAIESSEYNQLYAYISKSTKEEIHKVTKYLDYWYREDKNHLNESFETHFVLRVRRDESNNINLDKLFRQDFKILNSENKDYNINWVEHEETIRRAFQEVVKELIYNKKLPKDREKKYFCSATEAEVEEGIFKYFEPTKNQKNLQRQQKNLPKLDKEYVFGFIRDVDNIDKSNQDYEEVIAFQKRLTSALQKKNIIRGKVEKSYLRKFEFCMIRKLKQAIIKQIKLNMPNSEIPKEIIELTEELYEQLKFKRQKLEIFYGRDNELRTIQKYIGNNNSNTFDYRKPMVIYGVSGIGKSAFMAKCIDNAENILTSRIIFRFIGVSASSSNIRSLLKLLIFDLINQKVLTLSKNFSFEEDTNKFNIQIKEILQSIKKPTIIFLDALDQLQEDDYLQWLPFELPKNLKIVLSILNQDGYDHYYKLLEAKTNHLLIPSLKDEFIPMILDELLAKSERGLTPEQHILVVDRVKKSGNSPLYLKIVFEEFKNWKSYDVQYDLQIGIQEAIKEYIENLTEKYHHSKDIVYKVLGLISASKNGLSEKELLDLLSKDNNILNSLENYGNHLSLVINGKEVRHFPLSVWGRFLEQLKPFFSERLVNGQKLIVFFHRQMDEVVQNHVYNPHKLTLHNELADYFLTLQNKEKLWDERYYNLHMLDELPYHFFKANDTEGLREIIFDLEFAGSIYNNSKQIEFKKIFIYAKQLDSISHDEIYPWESFYNENEHLIQYINEEKWRPHQTLFQLAYEDGEDSPISRNADFLLKNQRVCFPWMKNNNRALTFNRIGVNNIFYGHEESVLSAIELLSGDILSVAVNGEVCIWNKNGYLKNKIIYKELYHPMIHQVPSGKILLEADGNDGYTILLSKDGDFITQFQVRGVYEFESLDNDYFVFKSSMRGSMIDMWFEIRKQTGEIVFSTTDHSWFRLDLGNGTIMIENYKYDQDEGFIYLNSSVYNYLTRNVLFPLENPELEGFIFPYLNKNLFLVSNENTYIFDEKWKKLSTYNNLKVTDALTLDRDSILAYSKYNNILYIMSLKAKKELKGHNHRINKVWILHNNILSCDQKGYMICWSKNGELLYRFDNVNKSFNRIEEMLNGDIVACDGDNIYVWNKHGELINTICNIHDGFAYILKLRDNILLSYSLDGTLKYLDYLHINTLCNELNNTIISLHKINKNNFMTSTSRKFEKWNLNGKKVNNISLKNIKITNIRLLKFKNILLQDLSEDNYTLDIVSYNGKVLYSLEGHTSSLVEYIEINSHLLVTTTSNELIIWDKLKERYIYFEKLEKGILYRNLFVLNNNTFIAASDRKIRQYSSTGEIIKEINTGSFNYIRIENYLYFIQKLGDYISEPPKSESTLVCLNLSTFDIFYVMNELKNINTLGPTKKFSIVSKLDEERMLLNKDSRYIILNVLDNTLIDLKTDDNFVFEKSGYGLIVGIDEVDNKIIVLDFHGKVVFSDNSLSSIEMMNTEYKCLITKEYIFLRGMFGVYKQWNHRGKYLGILYFPSSDIDKILIEKNNYFLGANKNIFLSYELLEY